MAEIPNHEERMLQALDSLLDKLFDRLERAEGPVWEAHAEYGRTIITLASGALVLSITVAQLLLDKMDRLDEPWLLIAAWIAFGLSVLAGVNTQAILPEVRSFRLLLEARRGNLRQQIPAIAPHPDRGDRLEQLLLSTLVDVGKKPEGAFRIYRFHRWMMGVAFLAGLTALIVFTALNLP